MKGVRGESILQSWVLPEVQYPTSEITLHMQERGKARALAMDKSG